MRNLRIISFMLCMCGICINVRAQSRIILWDTDTGKTVKTFSGHTDNTLSVSFSPNGKQLLSGSLDNSVKLWDVSTGRLIRTFSGDIGGAIYSVCFSPDGKQALSGSLDNSVKLWDVSTGRLIRTFSGHTDIIRSVSFSPDGKKVLSSSNKTIIVWDIFTGGIIKSISHGSYEGHTSFSPDGTKALLPNAGELWDLNSGERIMSFGFSGSYGGSFSPDGNYVLTVVYNLVYNSDIDRHNSNRTIRLWDIVSGMEKKDFPVEEQDIIRFISFSPDGKKFLVCYLSGTTTLWDIATSKKILTFDEIADYACFSPDGKQIVSCCGFYGDGR